MMSCPGEETLRSVSTGALTDEAYTAIEAHVEGCEACQAALEQLACGGDESRELTRFPGRWPTVPGFTIERELGHGANGVVYLAHRETPRRRVALKLLPGGRRASTQERLRWLREANAAAAVRHPHIVTLYEAGVTHDRFLLAMEYVPGGTLGKRLTQPLAPRTAARMAEIVARAVDHIHQSGLLHLDLKPSNILLEGDPDAGWDAIVPKVTDFGIAQAMEAATDTGGTRPGGTPSYMAPEQIDKPRKELTAAADVHGLGAMLYHMLTGRPPYQGVSVLGTIDLVRSQEAVRPRRLNPAIPRDLETICLKCLEKNPKRRYATADALATDLRYWLDDRPIRARRISPMGYAWRLCRRHPGIAGLLMTLATTLALGVAGLLVLLGRVEIERTQVRTEQKRVTESRRRTEVYEQFAERAAEQLAFLVRETHRTRPDAAPALTEVATLLDLRSAIDNLRAQGIVPRTTVGILEMSVGNALNHGSTAGAGQSLLSQSAEDLKQSLANNPNDKLARFWLLRSVYSLGNVAESAGQLEAAMNWYEQAAAIETGLEPAESDAFIAIHLFRLSRELGNRVGQSGRPDLEVRSQLVSQKIRRYLLGSGRAGLTGEPPPGLETLSRILERQDFKVLAASPDKGCRDRYASFVGELLLLSVESLSPFRSPSAAAAFDRECDAGAITLISALRELCAKLGLPDSLVPATIRALIDAAVSEAAEHRRLGRLDDARATTVRLMALGRQVVREYPGSLDAHRVLTEAYSQHEQIGWALVDLGRGAEAREFMNAVLGDLEQRLSQRPDNADARRALRHALFVSAHFTESADHLEGALVDYERASAIRTDLELSESTYGDTIWIYQRTQAIMHRLRQGGQTGQREHARRLGHQIFHNLIGSEVEFGPDASVPGLETVGRLFEREDLRKVASQKNKDIGFRRDQIVADWLAISVERISPFRSSSTAAKHDREPEASSIALISALREQCSNFHLAESMVPVATNSLITDAVFEASEQRKLGRLDDARATAARLMALAKRLVVEYPESGHAYRVLSEAFNQHRKNAIKAGDKKLEELSLVQAIEAAQRALALGILGPDASETRRHLDNLTEKLADLKAERTAVGLAAP